MKTEYQIFAELMFGSGDADYRTYLYAWTDLSHYVKQDLYIADHWFYHAGVASWITSAGDDKELWARVLAEVDTFPRGSERRHFRKAAAMSELTYVDMMVKSENPGLIVNTWFAIPNYRAMKKATNPVPQIGPFIQADMYEAAHASMPWLGLEPVSLADLDLYKSPLAGAALLREGDETPKQTAARLIEELSYIKAPPFYDRPFGPMEVETLFCRWKKYKAGKYVPGDDRLHCLQELAWRESPINTMLLETDKRWLSSSTYVASTEAASQHSLSHSLVMPLT